MLHYGKDSKARVAGMLRASGEGGGLRVCGFSFRVFGFRGLGFRVLSLGFRGPGAMLIKGLGFRALELSCCFGDQGLAAANKGRGFRV